ncbi:MAG: rane protein, partial [Mycobacterium sp.]|nr:rane protein [Mycobacterium sp.]
MNMGWSKARSSDKLPAVTPAGTTPAAGEDPGAAAKVLSNLIETGSRVQAPAIRAYVGRLRAANPDATP